MLIISRIFPRSTSIICSIITTRSVFKFADVPDDTITRNQLKQLHAKIVNESTRIRPDVLIKTLNYVHKKSQQIQSESIVSETQMDKIVQALTSSIHQLSHQDLTILLETISQYNRYAQYNRSGELMKQLIKKLNSVRLLDINPKYIFRLLNMLQQMRFPYLIINRYVNHITSAKDQKKFKHVSTLDTLKFFMTILEMRFIHVIEVEKFYQKFFQRVRVQTPKEMVYLHYCCSTIDSSLQNKITYFSNKAKLHDIVFNPYNSLAEINQSESAVVEQNNKTSQEGQVLEDLVQKQQQKMKNISQNLVAQIHSKINLKKLKDDICKNYDFEKYPIQTGTALLLVHIPEMKKTLGQYFVKNYKTMDLPQFAALLQCLPQKQRLTYLEEYIKLAWSYMDSKEKLATLKLKYKLCKTQLTKQELLQVVSQAAFLSTQQFELLSWLASQNMSSEDQLQIINAVDVLAESARQ